MSEHYLQPDEKQYKAARNLERIQDAEELLSPSGKDLAKLHPVVEDFVETDVKSVDFGRIKDVEDAHFFALEQAKIIEKMKAENIQSALDHIEGKPSIFDPETMSLDELDAKAVAASSEMLDLSGIIPDAVHQKVLKDEILKEDSLSDAELAHTIKAAYKVAARAATDYRITQGESNAWGRRLYDIHDDIAGQNPGITRAGIERKIDEAQSKKSY